MTKKRKRRSLEQIVNAIQEGEALMSAGKTESEVIPHTCSVGTWGVGRSNMAA